MLFKLYRHGTNKDKILEYIDSIEKDTMVHFRPPNRSRDQNALYWACISIIAKETGEGKEEMHAMIKSLADEKNIVKLNKKFVRKGKEYTMDISSADLDVEEFSRLINFVYHIASLANISLPDPDVMGYDDITLEAKTIFK